MSDILQQPNVRVEFAAHTLDNLATNLVKVNVAQKVPKNVDELTIAIRGRHSSPVIDIPEDSKDGKMLITIAKRNAKNEFRAQAAFVIAQIEKLSIWVENV